MPDEEKPASGAVSSVDEMKARPAPDHPAKPDSPTDLKSIDWKFTFKSALREFNEDQLTDLAAGLTYFAVLSIFPAIIALVSILSLFGFKGSAITDLISELSQQGVLPSSSVESISPVLQNILGSTPAPGLGLFLGILTASWAASNYVKAFGRAMNRIYEVQEGRGPIKLNLSLYLLTLVLLALVGLAVMLVVVSGPVAESIFAVAGISGIAATLFTWLKFPILAVVIVVALALLYHFTPNVKQPKMKWISIGAVVAIVVAGLASVLLGIYLTLAGNASYQSTYGTLAGVIIFLFWLWVMNIALLFGGEVDAELERARELRAGMEAEEVLQLPPRDTKGAEKAEEKAKKQIEEAKQIRLDAAKNGDAGQDSKDAKSDQAGKSDKKDQGSTYGQPDPDRVNRILAKDDARRAQAKQDKAARKAGQQPDADGSGELWAADRVQGSDARRPDDRSVAHKATKKDIPKAEEPPAPVGYRRDPEDTAEWMDRHEAEVARKAKLDRERELGR